MLERRLQEGMTLEESSKTQDLTRERVRQVESKFLQQVQRRLEYFTMPSVSMPDMDCVIGAGVELIVQRT